VPQFDPFFPLNDFSADDPADYVKGFPWNPHQGIETITYVLAGEVEHGESRILGYTWLISQSNTKEVNK
jgi:redox-sensitive bicupin YhaK (pirin superfamily)